jgi:hypothetical protein
MTIRDKLIANIANAKWASLGIADLDAGFAALTVADKQTIVDALKAGDDGAKILIKAKFKTMVDIYAATKADAYIAAGTIPTADLATFFN